MATEEVTVTYGSDLILNAIQESMKEYSAAVKAFVQAYQEGRAELEMAWEEVDNSRRWLLRTIRKSTYMVNDVAHSKAVDKHYRLADVKRFDERPSHLRPVIDNS